MSSRHLSLPHILLTALVPLLWSCDYIFAKAGVDHWHPYLFTMLRFLAVGILVVPFVPRPTGKQWRHLLELSFVLCTLHFTFLFKALSTNLDIATQTILGQLSTPFACVLGALIFRDRLGAWRVLGMLIAFLGIIVVVGRPSISAESEGVTYALLTALMFAVANLLMKRLEGVGHMTMVGWMSLMAAPQILVLSLVFESGQIELLQSTPLSALLGLGYSVLFSTIVAYTVWHAMIGKYTVSQIVPFGLLVPVFATIGAAVFLGQEVGLQTVLGGLVTIAGVAAIILPRPRFVPARLAPTED
jgi:O-acetylserine/cysteine efflux transporter